MYHGARLRVRGSGTLALTAYGLDGYPIAGPFTVPSQMSTPQGATLTSGPGAEYLQRYYAMSEYLSLGFECAGLDDWFQLSRADFFYVPAFMQR